MQDKTTIDGSPQEAQEAILEGGGHIAVQITTTTGTATVELWGRLTPNAAWVKFETITLNTDNFIKAYFGIPYIAAKVTAVAGGASLNGWVFYDD